MQAKTLPTRQVSFLDRWRGASALISRDFSFGYRSAGTHFALVLFPLVELLVFYFVRSGMSEKQFGATFFVVWTLLNSFTLVLSGAFALGSSIGMEKARGTLGLLKLTGIGPLGIVIGTFGVTFLQLGIYLLLQFPLLALAVFCGGVVLWNLVAVLITIMASTLLLGAVCYYNMVITENPLTGTLRTLWRVTQVVVVYFVLYFGSFFLVRYPVLPGSHWIALLCGRIASELFELSPHSVFREFLEPTFDGRLAGGYLVLCLTGGLWFLFLSLRRFELNTSQLEQTPLEIRIEFPFSRKRELGKEGKRVSLRCWSDPFLWRGFQFYAAGRTGLIWSSLISLSLFLCIAGMIFTAAFDESDPIRQITLGYMALIPGWFAFIGFAGGLIIFSGMCDSLDMEKKGKTLGMLFLIPRPPSELLMQLLVGQFVAQLGLIVPGLIVGLCGGILIYAMHPASMAGLLAIPVVPFLYGVFFYSGWFCGLICLRLGLIRSRLLKAIIVISGTLGFLLTGFLCFVLGEMVPSEMYSSVFLWSVVSILILTAYLCTIPLNSLLWNWILGAIRNHMADD